MWPQEVQIWRHLFSAMENFSWTPLPQSAQYLMVCAGLGGRRGEEVVVVRVSSPHQSRRVKQLRSHDGCLGLCPSQRA